MAILHSGSDGDGGTLFADINVTPMVDVMLVLLVIFMVTAPFMIDTIGVSLPKGSGDVAAGLKDPLTISLNADGAIFIADQKFSLDALKDFLQNSPRIKLGEEVFVEADENCRHGELVKLMSKAHEAGVKKINIMMERF